MKKVAIFAGSFNPFHEGHLSILKQGLKLFHQIIVLVANSDEKKNHDSLDERFEKVQSQLNFPNVIVDKLANGLVADYARTKKINFLIRSARDCHDFTYELLVNKTNQQLNRNLMTLLIMPNQKMLNIHGSSLRNDK